MTHLSEAQVAQFEAEGYLAVENLFDPAAYLDPIIKEYEGVLDSLARENDPTYNRWNSLSPVCA